MKNSHFTRMKTMKPHFKTFPHFHVLVRALLTAMAVFALSTAQMSANDEKSVSAATMNKLDQHLVLVVKKSLGDTAAQPDVYKYNGRVLVEIDGSLSKELFDQIASLGGQVVTSWGTNLKFRAWVPFAQVATLAGRADIRSMAAARPTITHRLRH
jgi:hypothetical protein